MLKVFTEADTKKIQIDEGLVVINLGKETQRVLGPTRGGAEVTITPVIRDIEFDGRRGKTAGMQVKDEEDATIKVVSLCCRQEDLMYGLPNAEIDNNGVITQGDFGPISKDQYLETIDVITSMLDGTFKILTFNYGLHEGAFTYKAAPKAENEYNLELIPHYTISDNSKLYTIKDSVTNPVAPDSNSSEENGE
jgi:hypothetical protein